MVKGLVLGLVFQVVVAVGWALIGSITGIKNDLLKAMLVVCVASVVAVAVVLYLQVSGRSQLATLSGSDLLFLVLGSIFVLVIGQILYLLGLSASNLTTMGLTALAYPIVALVLDLVLRRIALSSFTVRDFVGIGLVVVGFILLIFRGQ
jgi:drug/metabolite transporter (DMT)-like permease